jgi:AraC-like DNA-binding protein
MEKVYDSAELPFPERLDAWADLVSRMLTPSTFHIDRPADFRASIRVMGLGASQVSALTYPSMWARRTPRNIRQCDPEMYVAALPVRGSQGLVRAGRETVLGADELAVYSTCRCYEARVEAGEGTAACVVAQVPRALVPLPPDKVDRLLAVPLSHRDGIGGLFAHFLTQLRDDTGAYRPADHPRLGMVLLDLFTVLLAQHLDDHTSVPPEARTHALLLRVEAFVQRHLGDPFLTPATLAAAHHISVRHLHRLFGDHRGTTVAAHIRRQRLERCRHDLADPAFARLPVHAVGARWGFTDAAVFSRAFRAAYGMPPRDYRHHARPR